MFVVSRSITVGQQVKCDSKGKQAKLASFLFSVLDYIRNNVTKQYELNEKTARRIAGLLNDYESKLRDLRGALKEAEDTVEKAKAQNRLNTAGLEALEVPPPAVVLPCFEPTNHYFHHRHSLMKQRCKGTNMNVI